MNLRVPHPWFGRVGSYDLMPPHLFSTNFLCLTHTPPRPLLTNATRPRGPLPTAPLSCPLLLTASALVLARRGWRRRRRCGYRLVFHNRPHRPAHRRAYCLLWFLLLSASFISVTHDLLLPRSDVLSQPHLSCTAELPTLSMCLDRLPWPASRCPGLLILRFEPAFCETLDSPD